MLKQYFVVESYKQSDIPLTKKGNESNNEDKPIEVLVNNLLVKCKYPNISDELISQLTKNEFIVSVAEFLDKKSYISVRQRTNVSETTYYTEETINKEWFKANRIVGFNIRSGYLIYVTKEMHLKTKLTKLENMKVDAENTLQEIRLDIRKTKQQLKYYESKRTNNT